MNNGRFRRSQSSRGRRILLGRPEESPGFSLFVEDGRTVLVRFLPQEIVVDTMGGLKELEQGDFKIGTRTFEYANPRLFKLLRQHIFEILEI